MVIAIHIIVAIAVLSAIARHVYVCRKVKKLRMEVYQAKGETMAATQYGQLILTANKNPRFGQAPRYFYIRLRDHEKSQPFEVLVTDVEMSRLIKRATENPEDCASVR